MLKTVSMEKEKSNKWLKWIRTFGIVLIVLNIVVYLLIMIGNNKGKKLQYDELHSIYYSEDYFDPSYIRLVGDSLQKLGYFSPTSASDIQLFRSSELGDTVVVGYLVEPSKLTPEIKDAYKEITQFLYPLLRTFTQIHFKDGPFNIIDQMPLE